MGSYCVLDVSNQIFFSTMSQENQLQYCMQLSQNVTNTILNHNSKSLIPEVIMSIIYHQPHSSAFVVLLFSSGNRRIMYCPHSCKSEAGVLIEGT